jgi:multicomponent Na+:H+ antiporter subunit E
MRVYRPVRQGGEATPQAVVLLFLILAVSWVLWSGLYKPLLLALGAFSCVLTVILAQRMGFFRHQAVLKVLPRLPGYWWWLLREIIVSSVDVAKLILKPSLPVDPVVVELETQTRSDVARVILANSITLSPGTVTLDMHNGRLLVHCLTRESARALQEGEADRRAARLGLG